MKHVKKGTRAEGILTPQETRVFWVLLLKPYILHVFPRFTGVFFEQEKRSERKNEDRVSTARYKNLDLTINPSNMRPHWEYPPEGLNGFIPKRC